MRIRNDRFVDYWFERSKDIGRALSEPKFIVMHYTAGASGAGSRDYMLKSPTQKASLLNRRQKVYGSAHLVVDRSGEIWQIVPFDEQARHAGTSEWRGVQSLNRYSIGIEIANYGWLDPRGDGSYGRSDTPEFQPSDVIKGQMPHGQAIKGWEPYPEPQLDAVAAVTAALIDRYPSIMEIVGHSDISPRRKFDPGPAFPMERFQNLVDSRGVGAVDDNSQRFQSERYVTTTRLNIRGGPDRSFEKLDESPLAHGTKLVKLSEENGWYYVRIVDNPGVHGFVYHKHVRLASSQSAESHTTQAGSRPRPGVRGAVLSRGAATRSGPGEVDTLPVETHTNEFEATPDDAQLSFSVEGYESVAFSQAHLVARNGVRFDWSDREVKANEVTETLRADDLYYSFGINVTFKKTGSVECLLSVSGSSQPTWQLKLDGIAGKVHELNVTVFMG